MNTKLLSLVLLLTLVGGCDFFNSQAKRAEIIKLEEKQAERVATERKDASLALKTYIEGKCKLVEEETKSIERKLADLTADSTKLEQAIAKVMEGAENADQTFEVRVLRVLKDQDVNDIAQKYLSTGFSAQRETFVAKVRELRAKETEYRNAIKKCDQAFDEAVEKGKDWVGASKEARDAEIKRLTREIDALERKRSGVRRSMSGSLSQEREREEKRRDYDDEIARKRAQIDTLRNPRYGRQSEERAASEHQFLYDRASSVRRIELQNIDRRLKPTVSVVDIAKETELKTIGELRKEIRVQRDKASASLEKLGKNARTAKELLLEVLVSDGEELKRLRLKVDKLLSLSTAQ